MARPTKRLRGIAGALLLLTLALPIARDSRAVQVYHTDEEALAIAFPEATRIEQRAVRLDDAERARVEERIGNGVQDRVVLLREAYRDDTLLGRSVVLEEIGKTLPFRFLVAVTPEGHVDQVLLLNYREPRGGEIERAIFRKQYRGKNLEDPIRRGRDIRNVTGATISVDSLSRGVRRALALCEVASGKPFAAAQHSGR